MKHKAIPKTPGLVGIIGDAVRHSLCRIRAPKLCNVYVGRLLKPCKPVISHISEDKLTRKESLAKCWTFAAISCLARTSAAREKLRKSFLPHRKLLRQTICIQIRKAETDIETQSHRHTHTGLLCFKPTPYVAQSFQRLKGAG